MMQSKNNTLKKIVPAILILITIILLISINPLHQHPTKATPNSTNQQHTTLLTANNETQQKMTISISNTTFSKTNCTYVNISGIKKDVQNVRINISWNPTIINLSKTTYNTDLWPMPVTNTKNYQKGFLSFHLYNLSNAYGVDINGEYNLAKLCFKATDGLTEDTCSDVILTEHELTTGSHEDINCDPYNTTICISQNNDQINNDQNPNQDTNENDDNKSLVMFSLILIFLFAIGISAIILIIKK